MDRVMKMKIITVLGPLLLGLAQSTPAADTLSETLQKGLFEEEANHNLDAAIKAYQAVLQQTDEQRKLAATAIFRLGECYRKLGRTNDATAQYARILREFGDQSRLADLSRQSLAGFGVAGPATNQARDLTASTDEEEKEVQRIKEMIKNSPDLINSPGQNGWTPLHKAASLGPLGVARFLLANKADVNSRVSSGKETPLQLAAEAGHKSMTEFLLANGADVNAGGGQKAETALHAAAAHGFKSVAEVLLANKADVNARNKDGNTPLHTTAEAGQKTIAELLLAKGAEVNAKTSSSFTPLYLAVQGNHPAMVDLFLSQKGDATVKDANSLTPLRLAVERNSLSIAESLLRNGADVSLKGEEGTPILRAALRARSVEMLKLLLSYKPDLEATDRDGLTLLQAALAPNRNRNMNSQPVPLEIVQLLLTAGANVNAPFKPASDTARWLEGNINSPNITKMTPLMVATLKGRVDLVEALLQHGAE